MEQILFTGLTPDDLLLRIEQIIDAKFSGRLQQIHEKQSDYLTRLEVSKLLKISLPTLNEWTKLGWLQSYKMGNRVLYKEEEVNKSLHQVLFQKHKKLKS